MAIFDPIVYIWEGRFKNTQKNIQRLIKGSISASRMDLKSFYQQADLVTKKTHVTGSYGMTPRMKSITSGKR